MRIANLQHPWLLVLDNADDPTMDYQPYFPLSTWGVVMMTSRNEDTHQYATARPTVLQGLSVNAARDLLMKAARVPADQHSVLLEDATRVATLLQSHPLAVIQAGAYVALGGCRLSQYPAVYSQQRRRLLEFRPSQAQSRYRDVYATFEASADALKQSSTASARDALDLLPLLAVGAATHLPLMVFEAAWQCARAIPPEMEHDPEDENLYDLTVFYVARLPPFLDVKATAWDAFRLAEAVQQLKSFALVTTNMSRTSVNVSMHPLVQAWSRDRQNADEQHRNWLSMACIMVLADRSGTVDHMLKGQLQAHVESVIDWRVDTMFADAPSRSIARVLVQCGWILHYRRNPSKVRALVRMLMARLGLDEEKAERAWLDLYELSGRNLSDYGMPVKAIPLLEQIVEFRKESVAMSDWNLQWARHSLAVAYQKAGHTMEAITLMEEVVRIQKQTLEVNYPERLILQHTLARMYHDYGQTREAITMMEEVVRIDEQTLEANDPERLISQDALARMYHDCGQTREAVTLMEEVVRIREKTLEVDDSERLTSQHKLAVYLWEVGECERAYELMSHVVQRRAYISPEDDPDRRKAESWLKVFQEEMGISEE